LFGRLYWYLLVPFHAVIFARMCQRIAAQAARGDHPVSTETRPVPL
jgi:hypothetical protein